eukprot:475882_1
MSRGFVSSHPIANCIRSSGAIHYQSKTNKILYRGCPPGDLNSSRFSEAIKLSKEYRKYGVPSYPAFGAPHPHDFVGSSSSYQQLLQSDPITSYDVHPFGTGIYLYGSNKVSARKATAWSNKVSALTLTL